jgi:hypothetical protein
MCLHESPSNISPNPSEVMFEGDVVSDLDLALVKIVKRRIKSLFIWMLVFKFKFLVNNVSPFWPGHY